MFLLFCCLLATCARAQTISGGGGEPTLIADAIALGDDCYELTKELQNEVGAIWFPDKVDLRNAFTLRLSMYFGDLDVNGADGIVFALQPISTQIGSTGGGLGVYGITPSLTVPFDTYQNGSTGNPSDISFDPPEDHAAIMRNGSVNHRSADNLAGPVRLPNIEDGQDHFLTISWEPAEDLFGVVFDGEPILEYRGDIVAEIFGNDPCVFYGFAAATGGLFNVQRVCLIENSFRTTLADATVCAGGQVLLDAPVGSAYQWTPSEGLDDPTARTVRAAPGTTTEYFVEVEDFCGSPPQRDSAVVTIVQRNEVTFVRLGADTTVCPGEAVELDVTNAGAAVYTWSDPSITGPVARPRVPGVYAVTVTREAPFCTASDRIEITNFPEVDFDLGPADTSLCLGESLFVAAGRVPSRFLNLANNALYDTLEVTRSQTVRGFVDDQCGAVYDELVVTFEPCNLVYLPTAFSPNGDGRNDRFYPQSGKDVIALRSFVVYNRWGGEVFRAAVLAVNDPRVGWDGQVAGEPAAAGVYAWRLVADFRSGEVGAVRNGSVTLVR